MKRVKRLLVIIFSIAMTWASAWAAIVQNSQGTSGAGVAVGTSTPVKMAPANLQRYELDFLCTQSGFIAYGSVNPTSGATAAPTPLPSSTVGAPIAANVWYKEYQYTTSPGSGFRAFIDDAAQVEIDVVLGTAGTCYTIEKTRPTSIP